jgi:hypothetical protein
MRLFARLEEAGIRHGRRKSVKVNGVMEFGGVSV